MSNYGENFVKGCRNLAENIIWVGFLLDDNFVKIIGLFKRIYFRSTSGISSYTTCITVYKQALKEYIMNVDLNEQEDLLLSREASLSAMALGAGLTHIGKYDYTRVGFFYSGMFSLCIGLERLLKLIIIYDYRICNNGCFPSNNILRNYGHKLDDLMKIAYEISNKHNLKVDFSLTEDDIFIPIIQFLTDFSTRARYYNLDTLTGQPQSNKEPLIRWNKEVASIIIKRHFHPSIERRREIELTAKLMSKSAVIHNTSDEGVLMDNFQTGTWESAKISTKQKYAKFYLYQIIRSICEIQRELEYKGEFYPYLQEYFMIFRSTERNWILRKKTWNPFPPYHF